MSTLFRSALISSLISMSVCAQMVFKDPPEGFRPKMNVATCYLRSQDRFLFLKRGVGTDWATTWDLPGGKVDDGETPEIAVVREIFEETGISLPTSAIRYYGQFYVRDPKKDFTYHIFEAFLGDAPPPAQLSWEHSEGRWMTLEEAMQLPLVPGELECIDLMYGVRQEFAN